MGYGCLYQSGYVFALDDTTPITGSVGGTVVSTASDTTSPWGSVAGPIWGVDANSSIISTSAGGHHSGQLYCDALNDGACTSSNIVIYSNLLEGGVAAANVCAATYGGYIDWYLPAICELGPYGSGGSYPTDVGTRICLSSDNIQNRVLGISSIASTFTSGAHLEFHQHTSGFGAVCLVSKFY